MYEMDLWPESLLAGGISKKSLIYKYYRKMSAKIYLHFDKILVSTKEHIKYIKELPNCNFLNIDYLPQYADTIFEQTSYKGINNGIIDLMFAGYIGKAQSIKTIIKAAHLLKDYPKYKFHIVGNGSEFESIKRFAEELETSNVIFYGTKPLCEMPKMYELADVMLVSLEDKSYANMTIPGKVQSYMAAGKPIMGSINGSCYNFIINNGIGWACASGDYESLANVIKNLKEKEITLIGHTAKEVYYKKYSKQLFINRLSRFLNKRRELLSVQVDIVWSYALVLCRC